MRLSQWRVLKVGECADQEYHVQYSSSQEQLSLHLVIIER